MELIRYIHLNPLRAKIVEDLKALDKYPWAGHSVILGRRKNPLIPALEKEASSAEGGLSFSLSSGKGKKQKQDPANPVDPACPVKSEDHLTGVKNKPLAEKTIEDILLHFGNNVRIARGRYRHFVKQGVNQGRRPELQGGGLVRSAGGNKAGLLGRKKEERDPPASPERAQARDGGLGREDERILGSGDFVEAILSDSDYIQRPKTLIRVPLFELVDKISGFLETEKDEVMSGNRKQKNCCARDLISFIAVQNMGYKFHDIARVLNIHPVTAGRCAEKGKKLVDNYEGIWDILE